MRDAMDEWLSDELPVYTQEEIDEIVRSSEYLESSDTSGMSDWELFGFLEQLTPGPARMFWMYEPCEWYRIENVSEDIFRRLRAVAHVRDWGWGSASGKDGKLRTVAERVCNDEIPSSNPEVDVEYIRDMYNSAEWPINSDLIGVWKSGHPVVYDGNHRTTAGLMKLLFDGEYQSFDMVVCVPSFADDGQGFIDSYRNC